MRPRPLARAAAAAALALLAPLLASGEPTRGECARAFEDAQLAQRDGKLRLAREKAALCASASCPAKLVPECEALGREIDASLPTLTVDARDGDAPAAGAVVRVDGAVAAGAVAVDPGEHELTVELGARRASVRVTVKAGERRTVLVRVEPERAAPPPPPPPRPSPDKRLGPGLRVAGGVLGGLAGASLVGFAVAGGLGLSGKAALEDPITGCKPFCTEADVGPVRTQLAVADGLLAAGAIAGAASIALLISDAALRAREAPLVLTPAIGPGLGLLGIAGRF